MVLDVKALEWAAENDITTAKLKAAKIPIYGKWYFPDLPAGVLMVNLKTGHLQKFGAGMRAGEVLFVTRDDLRRARLGPYGTIPEERAEEPATAAPTEPFDAVDAAPAAEHVEEVITDEAGRPIHMPGPSIFPLVFGLGLAITLLGLVIGKLPDWALARAIVAGLGFIYLLAGGIGWALQNHREGLALESGGEH